MTADMTSPITENKTVYLHDKSLWLQEGFLSEIEARLALDSLIEKTCWEDAEISMFGRKVKIPRLQAFVGDPDIHYQYSCLSLTSAKWPTTALHIREQLEQHTGIRFNAALLNLYRDGKDSMGWHRDDEKELGDNPIIASVSLGGSRRFLLRNNRTGEKIEIPLHSGSLLWMQGELQTDWQHSIPKTRSQVLPRINLTFRQFKNY